MNHPVMSMAPKNNIFSKSSSLLTRVMLCAGAQIVGHHDLWKRAFNISDLDPNFALCLVEKDKNKSK